MIYSFCINGGTIDNESLKASINSKLNLNYMTTCLDSTELGKSHLKAAMHQADYTIRPQIVRKSTCPKYFGINVG